jgi:hypothetical protein
MSVDTGEYGARQTVTNSAEQNEVVFAKHRQRMAEMRVQELELVLQKVYANAAESPDWIRYRIEQVMPNVKGA